MTERFDIEQVIRILGLEIRAYQADEGRDFDVACRITLEKLRKCKKYDDLEEQGLLIKLPCKVGDTVYKIYESLVFGEIGDKADVYRHVEERKFSYEMIPEVCNTVFLTKEEAEQKLKELSK